MVWPQAGGYHVPRVVEWTKVSGLAGTLVVLFLLLFVARQQAGETLRQRSEPLAE